MRQALGLGIIISAAGVALAAGAFALLQGGFMRGADNSPRSAMGIADTERIMHNGIMTTPLMMLTSSAFQDGGMIPLQYTCDVSAQTGAAPANPPLSIAHIPEGAASLALIMDDPDIPQAAKERLGKDAFDHWIVFDMPPSVTEIVKGATGALGTLGASSSGKNAYVGPCPPREYEPSEHRYVFRLYALDAKLGLPAGATKEAVLEAMQGHIIGEAELVGRYRRP